ncbi:hypothetical protein YQE_02951, partial [Dendroctonus ponderosae]
MDVEETAWEIEWEVLIQVVTGVQVTDLNQWKNVGAASIETAKVAEVSIETEKAAVVVLHEKACEKPDQRIETMVVSIETEKGDLIGTETWEGKEMEVLVEIGSNRIVLGRGETVIDLAIRMKEVNSKALNFKQGNFRDSDRNSRFDRDERDDRRGGGGFRRHDDNERNGSFSRSSNREEGDSEVPPSCMFLNLDVFGTDELIVFVYSS